MKKILLALLPLALLGSNLSEIANKATQNEISKIKELELKRANLNDEATLSSYMPSLSLEGSYGKNASTFPSIVAKESAGVLARIDFLLYDGGAREARLKMSQLLKNKAAIASDEAKNYLAFKAVNLYFNACALENIIAAKNAQANCLKGVLDKLEKGDKAGLAPKDELENVRAKYHLANSTQLEYKNKMEQILNEINLLTGEQISPLSGAKMAEISSNLASKNAELDKLSQDISLSEAKLSETRAGFLPQISLYDTYGFPLDLTSEILEERGITLDEEGFKRCMEEQRNKARKARKVTNYMGADATVYEQLDAALTSRFTGYDSLETESVITALTTENEVTQALADGDVGTIITEETTFYATMGGQEGDKGIITQDGSVFEVADTIKLVGGKIGHLGKVTKGMFRTGDKVKLSVSEENRNDTAKNHSATHLLQKALRIVLGSHVQQKGSLVTPDRLRFDFSHFEAMTPEEIAQTEELVNREIGKALEVKTEEMSMEDAKKTGAMALFDEKYGEKVRVVSMGDFSVELCGGTHVKNTSTIGMFKIVSETGISAGVRRIEALTSKGVLKYYSEVEKELHDAAKAAKSDTAGLVKKIEIMQEEIKKLQSDNESLKSRLASSSLGEIDNQVMEVSGVKFLAVRVDGVDMNGLRTLGDQLKNKIGEGVVLVASAEGDSKVNLLAMVTEDAQKKGAHAGNLIKAVAAVTGGGGGGRPNMAQAGGKKPEAIEDAFKEAKTVLAGQIK